MYIVQCKYIRVCSNCAVIVMVVQPSNEFYPFFTFYPTILCYSAISYLTEKKGWDLKKNTSSCEKYFCLSRLLLNVLTRHIWARENWAGGGGILKRSWNTGVTAIFQNDKLNLKIHTEKFTKEVVKLSFFSPSTLSIDMFCLRFWKEYIYAI